MKHVFKIEVVQTTEVEVTIDDENVNEAFMADFRKTFYPFTTLQEHAVHLARIEASEGVPFNRFVEGYGHINGKHDYLNLWRTNYARIRHHRQQEVP